MYEGRTRLMLVSIIAALCVLIAACAKGSPDTSAPYPTPLPKNDFGYTDISVERLAAMFVSKDFTLVNAHVPYEGEIPQTDLFIPYDEIEDHVDKLPNKDAAIVLYCLGGGMSDSAALELASLGYTSVLEVDGGMVAWEKAGNELLRE